MRNTGKNGYLGSLQVGTAGEGRVLVRLACPWAALGRGLAAGVQLGRAAVRKAVAESGVAASLTLLGWLLRRWTLRTT